jgi:hypothetical protein
MSIIAVMITLLHIFFANVENAIEAIDMALDPHANIAPDLRPSGQAIIINIRESQGLGRTLPTFIRVPVVVPPEEAPRREGLRKIREHLFAVVDLMQRL